MARYRTHVRLVRELHRLSSSHRAHARSEEQWRGNQLPKLLARGSAVAWREASSGSLSQRANSLPDSSCDSSWPVYIPHRLRAHVVWPHTLHVFQSWSYGIMTCAHPAHVAFSSAGSAPAADLESLGSVSRLSTSCHLCHPHTVRRLYFWTRT